MPTAPKVTSDEIARLRELHAAGKTCHAIAKDMHRSPATISKYAQELGLTWTNQQTALATAVKQQSNRDRRADQIKRLYDRADAIWERLAANGFKVVGFDKMGRAVVTNIDSDAIPGAEERALTGIAINCLVAAARLEAIDAGATGAVEAKGILGNLGEAMGALYGQLSHTKTPTAALADDGGTGAS